VGDPPADFQQTILPAASDGDTDSPRRLKHGGLRDFGLVCDRFHRTQTIHMRVIGYQDCEADTDTERRLITDGLLQGPDRDRQTNKRTAIRKTDS
jgi:hypothetical protein